MERSIKKFQKSDEWKTVLPRVSFMDILSLRCDHYGKRDEGKNVTVTFLVNLTALGVNNNFTLPRDMKSPTVKAFDDKMPKIIVDDRDGVAKNIETLADISTITIELTVDEKTNVARADGREQIIAYTIRILRVPSARDRIARYVNSLNDTMIEKNKR